MKDEIVVDQFKGEEFFGTGLLPKMNGNTDFSSNMRLDCQSQPSNCLYQKVRAMGLTMLSNVRNMLL